MIDKKKLIIKYSILSNYLEVAIYILIGEYPSCDSSFAPYEGDLGSCCQWRYNQNLPKCGIGEGKCTSDSCRETLKCGSAGNCKEIRLEVDDWSTDSNCCYDPGKFFSRKSMANSQFHFIP